MERSIMQQLAILFRQCVVKAETSNSRDSWHLIIAAYSRSQVGRFEDCASYKFHVP